MNSVLDFEIDGTPVKVQLIDQLGEGAYGVVWKAHTINDTTNKLYAVKCV